MKSFVDGFFAGMKRYGKNISALVNSVLLFTVYVLGVGTVSVIAKLRRKKFFEAGKAAGSYWSDLNLIKKPIDDYQRQF